MEKQKEDLRIRRTYKMLSQALITLMLKKTFEKITVKDICEEAMVHRTTFYSHFQDKYELLNYCVELFEEPFETTDITANSFDGYKQYYVNVAKAILKDVEDNKDFFMAFVNKNKGESLITRLESITSERIMKKLKKCRDTGMLTAVPPEVLASFYAGGCISAASWWIEKDMPFSHSEMVNYISLMINKMKID